MSGKQITELESTNVFAEGDLLLTRKTTSGTDKKINYTDLVESIGNPAIDGFVATAHPTESNTIILTPANNARIPRYFVGMKISFVSPITSTGNVKIKIGSLTAKDFVQYQTAVTVGLQANDYVEGVFITDKFHRINDIRSVANIYSNEYNVILTTIDPSNQFTTLNLVSSIGIPKQSYYDGMAISFITPENTKGVTLIHIDGIAGTKTIFEPDPEDFISLPLYANQIVRAIYKTAQGGFVRDGEAQERILVLKYSIDTTPSGINSFANLPQCIQKILNDFPNATSDWLRVIITINKEIDASNTVFNIDQDLSWITLRSLDKNITFNKNNKDKHIFTQVGGKFFNVESNTIITITNASTNREGFFINSSQEGEIILTNITIDGGNCKHIIAGDYRCRIILSNCTLSKAKAPIYSIANFIGLRGCIIKDWTENAIVFYNGNYGGPCSLLLINSDLRNAQQSTTYSILTSTDHVPSANLTVTQHKTKARLYLGEMEISANTVVEQITYNVEGGQD